MKLRSTTRVPLSETKRTQKSAVINRKPVSFIGLLTFWEQELFCTSGIKTNVECDVVVSFIQVQVRTEENRVGVVLGVVVIRQRSFLCGVRQTDRNVVLSDDIIVLGRFHF